MLPFVLILYHSSGSKSRKIFCHLMHMSRVIHFNVACGLFTLITYTWFCDSARCNFPLIIMIFFHLVMYFPRRLALVAMIIIVLLCIKFLFILFGQQSVRYIWKGGIYGEEISLCTVKRLVYQSILSLMVSAAIAIIAGRTDNLFFCNGNIYRSTGTINRNFPDAIYVERMTSEKQQMKIAASKTLTKELDLI